MGGLNEIKHPKHNSTHEMLMMNTLTSSVAKDHITKKVVNPRGLITLGFKMSVR